MVSKGNAHKHAQALLDFIDDSPSPWHAVSSIKQQLLATGFIELQESDGWNLSAGSSYFVIRGGSSIIAFRYGKAPIVDTGIRIIGAHTDSPGLRIKPNPTSVDPWIRLGVEIYGSPILATYTDRDLSLAGTVLVRNNGFIEEMLVQFDRPLLRLPNLAIHLNRGVNEEGLKLHKHTEIPLILDHSKKDRAEGNVLKTLISDEIKRPKDTIIGFELCVHDTHKGSFWGPREEFFADGRIDNLTSCHAALHALIKTPASDHTSLCAFFDHEEIGSESHKGASGSFLKDVLDRLNSETERHAPSFLRRALSKSLFISADAAHAFNPNFPSVYDPQHLVQINEGPALKINANQRYATDGNSAARFSELCRLADVPLQTYIHRSDLGCGSTIGPMTAAKLGIPTIDCGVPMWAMHSLRESAGIHDQLWLSSVMELYLKMNVLP